MTAPLLRLLLRTCDDSMIGRRDRALLAIGFAAALRRSELVALEVADLRWVEDGARLTVRTYVKRSDLVEDHAGSLFL